jgi:serine/threonine protein kinase
LLALEFCQNGTLFDFIQRHPSQCGRQLWIQWSKQIAQAVAFLHARHPVSPKVSPEKDESDAQRIQSTADSIDAIAVIHHDIKLHNVLLDDQLNAKLADFGSASLVGLSKDDSVLPTFKDGLGRGTQGKI